MGIVAFCPNGHRIKVKDDLAGKKGICPTCAAKFRIPKKGAQVGPESRGAATAPPIARLVSQDPHAAAALPEAFAIDEADTAAGADQTPDAAFGGPDFVLVVDEPDVDAAPAQTPPVETPPVRARPVAAPPRYHAALDERPSLKWCFAVRGGAPSAPCDAAAMNAWLASGEASANHVVWREDWPDWRPLAEVFPQALPPQPPGRQ